MAWIESHTVLLRHRKLIALAAELRIKPVYLLGHLHALWHSALEQQEDGDLSGWTDDMVALYADYSGDCSQFVSLLHKHRWLDDGRLIHDWLDYAGSFLRKKYSTSNRGKLIEIWKRHGRDYGSDQKASGKRPESDPKATLPNQPNLTNQTNPTIDDEALMARCRLWFGDHYPNPTMRQPLTDLIAAARVYPWDQLTAAVLAACGRKNVREPVSYAIKTLASGQGQAARDEETQEIVKRAQARIAERKAGVK